jgi:hypothetical protein
MVRRQVFLLVFVAVAAYAAAACAPSAGSDTSVPTLTLILATEVPTATAVPPTSTSANLPGPQDIVRPTETATPNYASDNLIGEALIAEDPVAAELVGIAQRLVSDQTDLPTRRIFLIDVRAAVWTDSTLNCPQPESEVIAVQSDGYRIVLQAGDQEFLFHTDFDRVVACDRAVARRLRAADRRTNRRGNG